MNNSDESIVMSLGDEPAEVLGFKTEEQIELALIPLMAEVLNDEKFTLTNLIKENLFKNDAKTNTL